MADDRWLRVEEIWHQVMESVPEERRAKLDKICADDDSLRQEVVSLIGYADQLPEFLNVPDRVTEPRFAAGAMLGPYRLIRPAGSGGMGEVWKALDTRLDRTVAVKISKVEFTGRFEQEARMVAALNHPHICQLFDVGPNYLVMEFIEGVALKGPMAAERALPLAIQLADAMAAAHRNGITHRDLKPANVLLAKSGVKVLDFGLAKTDSVQGHAANVTQEGMILGTLNYMAPEQLQGKPTDGRADIFSFGCVLYEMLTGKKAFDGTSAVSVIAAIMGREPPSIADVAPAELDWILRLCLAKDPDERWQSAHDLKLAVERVGQGVLPAALPSDTGLSRWVRTVVAVAVLAATVLAGTWIFQPKVVEAQLSRLNLNPPENTHLPTTGGSLGVSPDGKFIVFEAVSDEGKGKLWLRSLDSMAARPIESTADGTFPFWSPDSKSIGFFSGGKLKKVASSGGPAATLADAPIPRGGTWSRDGVIVFSPTPYGGLQKVPAAGGTTRPATVLNLQTPSQRFPWFLPDSKHFLYLGLSAAGLFEIRVASLDAPGAEIILPETPDSFALFSQGQLIFGRGGALLARPFDPAGLRFTGEASPVVTEPILLGGGVGGWKFSISTNGVLAYHGGQSRRSLTWVDRKGSKLGIIGEPGKISSPLLSPNQASVVFEATESTAGSTELWVYDIAHGLRTRHTFDPAFDGAPIWSPDGKTIFFQSNRAGRYDLYRKPADSSHAEELIYADSRLKIPHSLTPDGKYLAYSASEQKTGSDIWILPDPLTVTAETARPYSVIHSEFNESGAQFSADGKWLAYRSDESGKGEVYVVPFPGPGGKRQISAAGGSQPRWRRDGTELFFLATDGRLMAAALTRNGSGLDVISVRPAAGALAGVASYDVTPDGQRFLAVLPTEGETAGPLTVVQNWLAAVAKH